MALTLRHRAFTHPPGEPEIQDLPLLRLSEYLIPRLADYNYGHGCGEEFSPFRENPFSVAESGLMPLGFL